jgi:hypothetical protein
MSRTRWLVITALVACGGGGGSSKYPSRADGCAVNAYPDAPPVKIENIGRVSAQCGERYSKDECLRTLKDQVCKLGGDVVWGVPSDPEREDGVLRLSGRAAHTR